ncbi:cysteine-rich KTR domain-containing protein [Oliverpabstia intestinalis]
MRTQILDDTELKHFPLFCTKCKENFIINVKDHIVDYQSIARR